MGTWAGTVLSTYSSSQTTCPEGGTVGQVRGRVQVGVGLRGVRLVAHGYNDILPEGEQTYGPKVE